MNLLVIVVKNKVVAYWDSQLFPPIPVGQQSWETERMHIWAVLDCVSTITCL